MSFVQLAVLFFFVAGYSTLGVTLIARAIVTLVNDFRAHEPKAERYGGPNYDGGAEWGFAAEER